MISKALSLIRNLLNATDCTLHNFLDALLFVSWMYYKALSQQDHLLARCSYCLAFSPHRLRLDEDEAPRNITI